LKSLTKPKKEGPKREGKSSGPFFTKGGKATKKNKGRQHPGNGRIEFKKRETTRPAGGIGGGRVYSILEPRQYK